MTVKMTNDGRRYHAHFDCFSGAAGDMMLAACLDASDSLPYALLLGGSSPVRGGGRGDELGPPPVPR
ncbi:hypothetical protein THAOC_36878, partial [Thalassiosira oceanica]